MDQPDDPGPRNPAAAFDEMTGQLALVRRAMEGLAAERHTIPDYSETLGAMNARLDRVANGLAQIGEHPAMQLTPDRIATQIDDAAKALRAGDAGTIGKARAALEQATAQANQRERNARTVAAQRRFLWLATGAAIAATLLLDSFVPGMVARSLPESWRLPEAMAARVLRLDPWSAGEHMLGSTDPDR